MSASKPLNASNSGKLNAIAMLVEAGLSLVRGKRKLAAMMLGAAALAYRYSKLGFIAQLLIRFYQWRR